MSASAKPVKKVPGPPPAPGPTVSRVDRDFSNDSITPPSNDPGTPIVDWTISGTCRWRIDASGQLLISPCSGSLGELEDWGYQSAPWEFYVKSIHSVSFSGVVSALTTQGMFDGCSSLTSLDLSGLDTSSVNTMDGMFRGCSSLRAVAFGPKFSFDGAWWNRLPTPSEDRSTGRWVSSANGIAYMPGGIPSNVAATYVAQMKDEAQDRHRRKHVRGRRGDDGFGRVSKLRK